MSDKLSESELNVIDSAKIQLRKLGYGIVANLLSKQTKRYMELEDRFTEIEKLPEHWLNKRTHDQQMYYETPENYTLKDCANELVSTIHGKKVGV